MKRLVPILLSSLMATACATTGDYDPDRGRDFVDAAGDYPDLTDGRYTRAPVVGNEPDDTYDVLARDFDRVALGPRKRVPDATPPEYMVEADRGVMREVYVACPIDVRPCDPLAPPAGAEVTYIATLTPFGAGSTQAVGQYVRRTGFNGIGGFSYGEARAALGDDGAFSLACVRDELVLERRLGDAWTRGETVTLFWQGTHPLDSREPGDECGSEAR